MKTSLSKAGWLVPFFAVLTIPTFVLGDVVDFEDAASYGGDNAAISDSYFENLGLSISAVAGDSAANASSVTFAFEATDRDGTDGFYTSGNRRDYALDGDLGDYFLKAGTGNLSYNNAKYFKMSIDYKESTNAASGEIWDIDGPEQYSVTAFDVNGGAIATLISPAGGLDGKPWTWSFEVGNEIDKIEIDAIGTGTLRGFAFDNFDSTGANANATSHATPLPSSAAIALLSFGTICSMRRYSRKENDTPENSPNDV